MKNLVCLGSCMICFYSLRQTITHGFELKSCLTRLSLSGVYSQESAIADDSCSLNWEFRELATFFSGAWVTPALRRSAPPILRPYFWDCTARPWIPTGTQLPSFLDFDRRHNGISSYLSPIFGDVVYLYDGFLYLCLDLVYIFLV